MELLPMFQKAQRVRRFIFVQFVALVGWIIVQSSFSLLPAGRALPFAITIISEGIWWIALLVIMLFMFSHEYNRFAQAAIELEDANRQLREATNRLFRQKNDPKEPQEAPTTQEDNLTIKEDMPEQPDQSAVEVKEMESTPEETKEEEEHIELSIVDVATDSTSKEADREQEEMQPQPIIEAQTADLATEEAEKEHAEQHHRLMMLNSDS